MATDNEWLSIGEAADILQVSRDTLRRWEKKGKIKSYRSPSNRRMYKKAEITKTYQPSSDNPPAEPKDTQPTTNQTPSSTNPIPNQTTNPTTTENQAPPVPSPEKTATPPTLNPEPNSEHQSQPHPQSYPEPKPTNIPDNSHAPNTNNQLSDSPTPTIPTIQNIESPPNPQEQVTTFDKPSISNINDVTPPTPPPPPTNTATTNPLATHSTYITTPKPLSIPMANKTPQDPTPTNIASKPISNRYYQSNSQENPGSLKILKVVTAILISILILLGIAIGVIIFTNYF